MVTHSPTRLRLNPTRPTAGAAELRQAWDRFKAGPPAQLVTIHRADGTAAVVDVVDVAGPGPLGDIAQSLDVARRVLLADVEHRWTFRPERWLGEWRSAVRKLRPQLDDLARRHQVDPVHVERVADVIANHSSKQGKPVWPRVARLQVHAEVSRRVAFRALAVLRDIGLVETVGQALARGMTVPGGLVASSTVRLLTMPTAALRAMREARDELRAEEVARRLQHRRAQAVAASAAAALDQPTPAPEPEAPARAARSAAEAAHASDALAVARAALAAARGG